METQMETYPILFDCILFQSRICWETTYGSLSHNPGKYHNITEDWEGKKYAGIDLKWDYEKRTCRATIYEYILELRNKYGHMTPKNHNNHLTNTAQSIMVLHSN